MVHTEYVDIFVALSQDRDLADQTAHVAEQRLRKAGLPMHAAESSVGGDTLGWHFDSSAPNVGVGPKALWRIRMAELELAKRKFATGSEIAS